MNQSKDIRIILLAIIILSGLIFRQGWLTLFSITLTVILITAKLWSEKSLDQIHYSRKWKYQKGFPGECSNFSIEVENRKSLPLSWLRTIDSWPANVALDQMDHIIRTQSAGWDKFINSFSFRPWEKITRHFHFNLKKRGVYPVGPVQIESGDLFGFFEKKNEENTREYLTVYPELLPEFELDLPAEDPTGMRHTHHSLFEDVNQPIGVRPYQPGDSFKSIHWPATARVNNMQTKLYQPIQSKVLVIVLNITTTSKPWLGMSNDLVEQLVKVSATLVYQNYQKGYSIGIISNGCLAHADHPFFILPGKSREHLSFILESLAAVTPYITIPFEDFLGNSIMRIPYGSTIMVVTGLVSPHLVDTLFRIRSHRNQLALISLEEQKPPFIPGILTWHMPFPI